MLNFKDKNMTASCSFLLTQHSNFAKKCERQAPLRVDALFLNAKFSLKSATLSFFIFSLFKFYQRETALIYFGDWYKS